MLTITTCDGVEFDWHINEKFPDIYSDNDHPGLRHGRDANVISIQADGHELEYISLRFQNIPYCGRICIWHGEYAKFIFENLVLYRH